MYVNTIRFILSFFIRSNKIEQKCVFQNLLSLPWDQSSVVGYLGEVFHITIATKVYLIVNGVPLMLFISICTQHRAFYPIFKHSIDKWNARDKIQQIQHHRDGKKFICGLIRFHLSVKE